MFDIVFFWLQEIKGLREELSTRLNSSDTMEIIKEKEEQIRGLLEEGETCVVDDSSPPPPILIVALEIRHIFKKLLLKSRLLLQHNLSSQNSGSSTKRMFLPSFNTLLFKTLLRHTELFQNHILYTLCK